MVRSKLWFRCAAMRDPVSPAVVKPAVIGWEAKQRTVDLTIERNFTGEELVRRMKGWVTVNPVEVIEIIKKYGFMKIIDDTTLVIEFDQEEGFTTLQQELSQKYGDELTLEKI